MKIKQSIDLLEKYIELEKYKGYDPYDGLKSPLFKMPFFKSNKTTRFIIQQAIKRSPINMRPFLRIKKGCNPVTLGLCIQAYSYLYETDSDKKDIYRKKIDFLVKWLEKLIPDGYSGSCWGYDFDWEARYTKINSYQPTIVATGIITNALYIAYKVTKNKSYANLINSSSEFVLRDLNRSYNNNLFCFSYSPFDKQIIYNASMKGARLLIQSYKITKNELFLKEAKNAIEFVLNYQNKDGSWYYSDKGRWVDNYHTGYILDCIHEYWSLTKENKIKSKMDLGYKYYKNNFITSVGQPKFYNNNIYPIDCTSAAQSILTTKRFNDLELAKKIANWMIDNMQHSKGNFYFRKFNYHTIKTPFMRWSNAWMFLALSYLNNMENS